MERHHRTIKVMSARQGCTVGEAVHRYNMTPRDGRRPESAPAAGLFQRVGRDLPVPATEHADSRPPAELRDEGDDRFRVGDPVWIRRRGPPTRCTDVSRPGTVTRVVSEQLVEVDGVPWHVRCLRRRCVSDQAPSDSPGGDGDDGPTLLPADPQSDEEWHDAESGDNGQAGSPSAELSEPVSGRDTEPETPGRESDELRRSERTVQPPDRYGVIVPNDFR